MPGLRANGNGPKGNGREPAFSPVLIAVRSVDVRERPSPKPGRSLLANARAPRIAPRRAGVSPHGRIWSGRPVRARCRSCPKRPEGLSPGGRFGKDSGNRPVLHGLETMSEDVAPLAPQDRAVRPRPPLRMAPCPPTPFFTWRRTTADPAPSRVVRSPTPDFPVLKSRRDSSKPMGQGLAALSRERPGTLRSQTFRSLGPAGISRGEPVSIRGVSRRSVNRMPPHFGAKQSFLFHIW